MKNKLNKKIRQILEENLRVGISDHGHDFVDGIDETVDMIEDMVQSELDASFDKGIKEGRGA
jgi:hypothetical protein